MKRYSVTLLDEDDLGRTINVQGVSPLDNVEGELVRAGFTYTVDGEPMLFSILYNGDTGEFLDGDTFEVIE